MPNCHWIQAMGVNISKFVADLSQKSMGSMNDAHCLSWIGWRCTHASDREHCVAASVPVVVQWVPAISMAVHVPGRHNLRSVARHCVLVVPQAGFLLSHRQQGFLLACVPHVVLCLRQIFNTLMVKLWRVCWLRRWKLGALRYLNLVGGRNTWRVSLVSIKCIVLSRSTLRSTKVCLDALCHAGWYG